jgi:hypothetical protein
MVDSNDNKAVSQAGRLIHILLTLKSKGVGFTEKNPMHQAPLIVQFTLEEPKQLP